MPGKRIVATAAAGAAAAAAMVAAVVRQRWRWVEARGESGDWGYTYAGKGSTYSHWRQLGANKSDASNECVSGEVPMFGV